MFQLYNKYDPRYLFNLTGNDKKIVNKVNNGYLEILLKIIRNCIQLIFRGR